MSTMTKKGDNGTTTLMYGRPVCKTHPRIEAIGSLDELNAALGLARAVASTLDSTDHLKTIQSHLILLMGEVATDIADMERYCNEGFQRIGSDHVAFLEAIVTELESRLGRSESWAIPGPPLFAAGLHLARATCRRCERNVFALVEQGLLQNPHIGAYLNRLSAVLWLLARAAECQTSRNQAS
ncbi:MAG: cob(I)yrinic acid a,c-diamide adenosyltransferase [Verrucomicrobiae bacterium]|nr:cob(I)yrinic acid a,c-diamide adenosyltransferase [Verrucomicrobiae bacterium]